MWLNLEKVSAEGLQIYFWLLAFTVTPFFISLL
jgi:hypothetical protein